VTPATADAPPDRTSRRIRAARLARRPPRLGATVFAFAAVFTLAWVFFIRAPAPAPAPTVTAVTGTYDWHGKAPGASGVPVENGTFVAVASGDAGGQATWRNTAARAGTHGSVRSAYDATRRTETTTRSRTTHLGTMSTQTRLVGAWPPAWRAGTRSPLDYQGLAAVVRTAVEDRDASVGIKPLKDGDREVWRAALTLDGASIELVVDQRSGLVTWYSDARSTFTAAIDWAAAPADEVFEAPPAGPDQTTLREDDHTYEPSPAAAGSTAGFDPLMSDLAPDGYALTAVATAPAALRPVSWTGGDVRSLPMDLPGTAILQLCTRGLSQFTVEQVGPATLDALATAPDWQGEAGAGRLSYQEVTLQYGALAGTTASTWYQASGPSLLVVTNRRAVFVTGALTRQELISFAEGLKPLATRQPE